MFDFGIGSTELIVLGVIALIFLGPKDLMKSLRTLGQVMSKVRGLAREFQGQIDEAAKDAGLDDLKKDISKATSMGKDEDFDTSFLDMLEDDEPRTPGKVSKADKPEAKPSAQKSAAKKPAGKKPAAKKAAKKTAAKNKPAKAGRTKA